MYINLYYVNTSIKFLIIVIYDLLPFLIFMLIYVIKIVVVQSKIIMGLQSCTFFSIKLLCSKKKNFQKDLCNRL